MSLRTHPENLFPERKAVDDIEIKHPKALAAITWVLFAAQSVVLIIEANTVYSRGELTHDYEVFGFSFTSLGHFNLNPIVFLPDGRGLAPALGNHFEWIMWPLGLVFDWLLRIPVWVTLLIILQALPTAAIGPLGHYYARLKAKQLGLSSRKIWIVSLLPPVLGATNIWFYWDNRFDFHFQALQGFLLIASILALELDRTKTAIVLGILLMGTGETAFVLFLPIVVYLLLKRRLRFATFVAAGSAFTLFAPDLFGVLTQNRSAATVAYHYLDPKGPSPHSVLDVTKLVLKHPDRFVKKLWSHRLDAWSEIAASGFVGLASPLSLAILVGLGIPTWSTGFGGFAGPIFQTIIISEFPVFLSGVVMCKIIRQSWNWGRFLSIAMIAWSTVWLIVFAPVLWRQLVDVSNTQVGYAMQHFNSSLPKSTVIVSTNASLGDFPNHTMFEFGCENSFTLPKAQVAIVLDPWKGIQTCGPYELLQDLSTMAALPKTKVLGPTQAGVYAVEIDARKLNNRRIIFSPNTALDARFLIAPNTSHGEIATINSKYVITNRQRGGFVIEGIVADLKPYSKTDVTTQLSVNGSATIQVFNDASGVLLAQASLVSSTIESISLKFDAGAFVRPPLFTQGVGPFSTKLIAPLPLNPIEVRVSCPSGSTVNVYSVSIK